MADFTFKLKDLVADTNGRIGLDEYPIFDESYRDTLNNKIINHYAHQESGLETAEMFMHELDTKMREIMPMYNQLYLSERIKIDPLSTINIKTVSSSDNKTKTDSENDVISQETAKSDSENEGTGGSRAVVMDTPQNALAGKGNYASQATDTNSKSGSIGSETRNADGSSKTTNSSNATDESNNESETSGYQGHSAELLMRYRETFLNIDMLIIRDLSELFMEIWSTSENYSKGTRNNVYTPGYFSGGLW